VPDGQRPPGLRAPIGAGLRDVDPALRPLARVLPRGYGLRAGLAPQRFVMGLLGDLGARQDVQVVAVAPGVGVRLHRGSGEGDPTPVLVWLHGGGYHG
jgi:acetyl esterase/lipase